MATTPMHVTVEEYQKEWLEQEGVNASQILQEGIDERMETYGFDIEAWAKSHGNEPKK